VSTPAPAAATPRADGAPEPEQVAQKPAAAPVSAPTPSPAPAAAKTAAPASTGSAEVSTLKGPAARVVTNMQASLSVPTATSVRAAPAKLLIDNRTVINNALQRGRGGKVSFTHLIGFAVVKALAAMPEMNYGFVEQDGKPAVRKPEHVILGLAIDVQKPDGSRTLLVPSITGA
jgi:2-oxoglutarate dehydrogenase E1 component